MAEIEVSVESEDVGWICRVEVREQRADSHHEVRVTPGEMERFGHGRSVAQTVRDSMSFLLEREPPASILRTFSLSTIEHYFPDFQGGP